MSEGGVAAIRRRVRLDRMGDLWIATCDIAAEEAAFGGLTLWRTTRAMIHRAIPPRLLVRVPVIPRIRVTYNDRDSLPDATISIREIARGGIWRITRDRSRAMYQVVFLICESKPAYALDAGVILRMERKREAASWTSLIRPWLP